jgi:predicted RNase H-like nuclease (RuvC/YqgF family)
VVSYIVTKSHANISGNVYRRGEIVELSDEDALYLISQDVVIPSVEERLPNESDGLFAEIKKENSELKSEVEKLKDEISSLTEELRKKNLQIANFTAKKR